MYNRETGSAAFHGVPGISNTAGMALWATDYALQAATLGIDELFFHEGIGYKYNFVGISKNKLDHPNKILTLLAADPTRCLEQIHPQQLSP